MGPSNKHPFPCLTLWASLSLSLIFIDQLMHLQHNKKGYCITNLPEGCSFFHMTMLSLIKATRGQTILSEVLDCMFKA